MASRISLRNGNSEGEVHYLIIQTLHCSLTRQVPTGRHLCGEGKDRGSYMVGNVWCGCRRLSLRPELASSGEAGMTTRGHVTPPRASTPTAWDTFGLR